MALLLSCGVSMAGCDSAFHTGPEVPLPPPPVKIYPDTADKLMENFKNAYRDMDYDKYSEALHPNFRFLFKPEDAVGIPSDVLDRDGELTIAYNMFSGEPRP